MQIESAFVKSWSNTNQKKKTFQRYWERFKKNPTDFMRRFATLDETTAETK